MDNEKNIHAYPLNQIYFYLTEGCNLCCRHCWIAPKFQNGERVYQNLSVDLFKSVIQQAKELGLAGIKLTGGEPLLHPEIKQILEFICQEGIKLTLETNGILLTLELARLIARCKNPFVSVSIDSPDAKIHDVFRGVPGSFEKAKIGIKNLVSVGLKPQIIMTLMRTNKNQLEEIIKLAESLGAGSVKFNIVQPIARGEAMHKGKETLDIRELVELGRYVDDELSRKTSLKLFYDHPLAFRRLSRIFGTNNSGCGVCGVLGILGVLADGSYALCGIGETVKELVFGHIVQDSLSDVWNGTPILKELREGLPNRLEGICGDCLMKHRCLGSCIAQNYYRGKDLWQPFWYCAAAYNEGFFPETRLAKSALNV